MADSMTVTEAAGAKERADTTDEEAERCGAAAAAAAAAAAGSDAPPISQAPQPPPPPPPVFAVSAPLITRRQMALAEPQRRIRELRPRVQMTAHGVAAAAAAAAAVTQLANQPQHASASTHRAAAAAMGSPASFPATSPDSLHLALSPPSTAAAAAACPPPGPDAYDEPTADPRRALFFVAPEAGLVHNKPFSFELRATLHHASAANAAPLPPITALLFQLAVKVSAKPMEKRSNHYLPIDAVWIKAKETGEPKPPEADETDEDETGAKASDQAAASSASGRAHRKLRPATSASAAAASSGEASSAAHAISTLTTVPIRTVALSKAAREKIRDRSIGLDAIITTKPAESAVATAVARSLPTLMSRLHVTMTAVAQHQRGGLLEIVTTKGGAIAARPQQRYILIQAGFGYKLSLPAIPAAYELRFHSLQLRSSVLTQHISEGQILWERAITRIPLLPTPLAMPLFPTPPKRRRSSTRKGSGPGWNDRAGGSSSRSSSRTASASQKPTRSSVRQKKKKKRRGESSDSSYTSDASSPPPRSKSGQRAAASAASSATRGPLLLPTRHGRSLTALLSASKQLERKQDQPPPARPRVRASSDGPAVGERKSSEPPSAASAVHVADRSAGPAGTQLPAPLLPASLLPAKRKHATQPKAAAAAADHRRSHKKKAKRKQDHSDAASSAACSSSAGGGRAPAPPQGYGVSSNGAELVNHAMDFQPGAFDPAVLGLGLNPNGLNGRFGGGGGLGASLLQFSSPSTALLPSFFQPTAPPLSYQRHAPLFETRPPPPHQFARSQSPPRDQHRPMFHIRCDDEFPPPAFPPAPTHQQSFAAAAGAYASTGSLHSSQSAFAPFGMANYDASSLAHGGLPWQSGSALQSNSVSPPRYAGSAQHLSAPLGASASGAFQFAGAAAAAQSSYGQPSLLQLPPLGSPTNSPQPPISAPGSGSGFGRFLGQPHSPNRASASPHRHLLQSPNRMHMASLLGPADNSSPIHSSQLGGSPQPPGPGLNSQPQQDEVTAREMFEMILSPPPPHANATASRSTHMHALAPLPVPAPFPAALVPAATAPLHPPPAQSAISSSL